MLVSDHTVGGNFGIRGMIVVVMRIRMTVRPRMFLPVMVLVRLVRLMMMLLVAFDDYLGVRRMSFIDVRGRRRSLARLVTLLLLLPTVRRGARVTAVGVEIPLLDDLGE